jgi:ZIP family zinc transporter
MDGLGQALLYAALAGATIPLGGLIAQIERIRPDWLEAEFRHGVIAFGGGVLIAAIALVLVPEGSDRLNVLWMLVSFGAGGISFFLLDRMIERKGGSGAQLMAMIMDFVPESLALGAMLATSKSTALLLALLMAAQNLPEGFNAYREMMVTLRRPPAVLIGLFALLALLGPLAAAFSLFYLRDHQAVLGGIMLFASGGILYLTFQDIAPQTRLERHWGPPLGAVCGFMLGLGGHALLQ